MSNILCTRKVNLVKIGLDYLFVFYVLCVFALVFFPLPDAAQMAALSTYDIQPVPFQFVADIIRESPLVLTDSTTWFAAVTNRAIWQVIGNVVMTVPFGMILLYRFECSCKKTVGYTFALSLFIELTQLTGCFFIYNGSYRLCDIDDLLLNTLGGFVGYLVMKFAAKRFGPIARFDHALTGKRNYRYHTQL